MPERHEFKIKEVAAMSSPVVLISGANATVFIASDKASYIASAFLAVDGGMTAD
jgi:NAD(P)-dependent dehydrogenase (short-subunit alcohol dehydrogenase family)